MLFKYIILCLGMAFFTLNALADPFRLMVMGDSLSAGYHLNKNDSFYMKLEKALLEKHNDLEIIHFSRSGETTAGGVQKMNRALAQKPDAVLLELGVNDALRDEKTETIAKNLQSIIDTFQKNNIPVMLIGMQIPFIKPASYAQKFKQMYVDLAQKNNLILYPFFMDGLFHGSGLIALNLPNENLLSDRLHPSAKGVDIMVKNILPTVNRFLKSIR